MVAQVEQDGEKATYSYDFNNRLVKVEIVKNDEARVIEYEYDGLGNRIRRTETRPDGKKETVNYINDVSQPLTQALQEQDENNDVS